jgi:hypothetical protein
LVPRAGEGAPAAPAPSLGSLALDEPTPAPVPPLPPPDPLLGISPPDTTRLGAVAEPICPPVGLAPMRSGMLVAPIPEVEMLPMWRGPPGVGRLTGPDVEVD